MFFFPSSQGSSQSNSLSTWAVHTQRFWGSRLSPQHPNFSLLSSEPNWWAGICQDENANTRHQHLYKTFLPALPTGILGTWIFVLIIQISPPLVLTNWVHTVSHCFLPWGADCCKSLLIHIQHLEQRRIPAFSLERLYHKLQSLEKRASKAAPTRPVLARDSPGRGGKQPHPQHPHLEPWAAQTGSWDSSESEHSESWGRQRPWAQSFWREPKPSPLWP